MFAVAVYNLYTGMEVCRSEDSSMKKILEEYNVLKSTSKITVPVIVLVFFFMEKMAQSSMDFVMRMEITNGV